MSVFAAGISMHDSVLPVLTILTVLRCTPVREALKLARRQEQPNDSSDDAEDDETVRSSMKQVAKQLLETDSESYA
jgi:hypothetical protein